MIEENNEDIMLKNPYLYLVLAIIITIVSILLVGGSRVPADTGNLKCTTQTVRQLEENLIQQKEQGSLDQFEEVQRALNDCRGN